MPAATAKITMMPATAFAAAMVQPMIAGGSR
jgi:hypothetical protein